MEFVDFIFTRNQIILAKDLLINLKKNLFQFLRIALSHVQVIFL